MKTKKEIETMISAIYENETEAWKTEKRKAIENGYPATIPPEEIERRTKMEKELKKNFLKENIAPETFSDDIWLSRKIKKILE